MAFEELRKEIGKQGSTWEAYSKWLETTQGRMARIAAEADRMKRRIGESASDIATYLGSVFLPAVNVVFSSWKGIVANAVGDVAGNLESAIEVQMQLGRVRLGQEAMVTVDSFPGRGFAGQITQIADQAEFTPRSVQTQEERVNTVFAVKITLRNPEHLLKPGMPADAIINVE